jgi:RNA polymerase sigma factor (sigma-70 family)
MVFEMSFGRPFDFLKFVIFLFVYTFVLLHDFSNISNLISSLQQKDERAFAYLYDNYSAALYGVVLKVVSDADDANDVLQEAFVSIWKSIDTYDANRGGSLFTWMLNIARNKAIDRFRQKNRIVENQKELRNVSIQNEHLNLNALKTDTIGINNLVSKIKPELKELIDLHYYKGFTHQEITEITNLPLGTVKTKMRSAMTELKSVFGIK